jgi:hypothetical protein
LVRERLFDSIADMVGGLLEGLEAAIVELAAVDADALDDTALHDTVVALATLTTRLEAVHCRLVGVWDRRQLWADNGSKAAGARLARATHWRRGDAERVVRRARHLTEMPRAAKAYTAGEITGAHVDLIASCDREWRNAEFADSEELLVNLCRTPYFGVAYRGIEYWKQCADRDAADRDADSVKAGRHLSASVGWRGELVIDGALDPLGGETFKTELDRICEQLRLQDVRDGATRTATQRRADALVEIAMRSATAPADGLRPRPLLTVTIGIEPFTHLCQTAAGTVIAPGLVLPYLTDADIERIVYDPPNRRFEASHRRRFTGATTTAPSKPPPEPPTSPSTPAPTTTTTAGSPTTSTPRQPSAPRPCRRLQAESVAHRGGDRARRFRATLRLMILPVASHRGLALILAYGGGP